MMAVPRYFVTGATGFLGREVLARLLAVGAPVAVTMRKKGADDSLEAATRRLAEMVERTAPGTDIGAAKVMFADVTQDGLGLSDADRGWLLSDDGPVQVIHGPDEVILLGSQEIIAGF